MAEPKSLLDRIGDALKGEEKKVEEKKAEVVAGAKEIAQAVPAAVASKAADVKEAAAAVADKLESQVADLKSQLAKKEFETAQQKGELAKQERQWMAKERELTGKVTELEAALKAAQAEIATLKAAPAARAIAAENTYVVKAGDSLSAIAKAVYGNAARWPEIFEANKDLIKDPKLIRPGQELRIP